MSRENFDILGNILFLKKNSLFSTMNTRELKAVASICKNHSLAPGEKVVTQGDVGETMFLIKSGTVMVQRDSEQGSIDLATLTAGESFGEMSMFDTELRSASIIVKENCDLLSIDGSDIHDLLQAYPQIGIAVIKTFVQRLRESNSRLQEVAQSN